MAGSKIMLVSVIEKLAEKVGDQFSITVYKLYGQYISTYIKTFCDKNHI